MSADDMTAWLQAPARLAAGVAGGARTVSRRVEPIGWNVYTGAGTFMWFIPNKPRLDLGEYRRRRRARMRRKR